MLVAFLITYLTSRILSSRFWPLIRGNEMTEDVDIGIQSNYRGKKR